MLESIATAHSGCTTKHEKQGKLQYNTDYIIPDLIYLFGNDRKKIRTQIKKRNIYIF